MMWFLRRAFYGLALCALALVSHPLSAVAQHSYGDLSDGFEDLYIEELLTLFPELAFPYEGSPLYEGRDELHPCPEGMTPKIINGQPACVSMKKDGEIGKIKLCNERGKSCITIEIECQEGGECTLRIRTPIGRTECGVQPPHENRRPWDPVPLECTNPIWGFRPIGYRWPDPGHTDEVCISIVDGEGNSMTVCVNYKNVPGSEDVIPMLPGAPKKEAPTLPADQGVPQGDGVAHY